MYPVPFYRKAGVEMTFLPPDCQDENLQDLSSAFEPTPGLDAAYAAVEADMNRHERSCPYIQGWSSDIHVLEVQTEPLKDWRQLEQAYRKTATIMSRHGCLPQGPRIISGGGHIHIGESDDRVVTRAAGWVLNRPWLTWAFNDPGDQFTNSCLASYAGIEGDLCIEHCPRDYRWFEEKLECWDGYASRKELEESRDNPMSDRNYQYSAESLLWRLYVERRWGRSHGS